MTREVRISSILGATKEVRQMARKQETRTIGEHEYKVLSLGAIQGRTTLGRLVRIAAPFLEAAQNQEDELPEADGGPPAKTTKERAAVVMGAVVKAIQGMTDEDVTYFCDVFCKGSTVKIGNKEPDLADVFDQHFACNYDELLGWLKFCVEVNFGSFFRKALGRKEDSAPPQVTATE